MRLTIVTEDLHLGGGVARVVSMVVNYWAARGWRITVLTYDDGHIPPFYDIDPGVNLVPLSVNWYSPHRPIRIMNQLRRTIVLRRAIQKSLPDVVISPMVGPNILTLLATWELNLPVVVWEHIDPTMHAPGKAWKIVRKWVYPQAHRFIVLSDQYRYYFSPKVQEICQTIPNPVVLPTIEAAEDIRVFSKQGKKTLLTLGRLAKQKGFDWLLQAFAQIAPFHPEWELTIWGEGPERANLEKLREHLGLERQVRLPGQTKQVFEKLRQADLFVLPSRFEGFPNVLGEAMACGLPVIAFDCAAGVRDIIRDGVDGVLVPPGDVDALAVAMDRLMRDVDERQRLAARAPEVLERFSLEKVMGMWDQVFQEVRQKKGLSDSDTSHAMK